MKRLAFLVPVVAVVALAPVALAGPSLLGNWKVKIKHDHALGGALNGTWVLKLGAKHFTAVQNGKVIDKGKLTFGKGHKITFHDNSGPGMCPSPGKYKYAITSNKLKLTAINDSNPRCVARKDVLTHGAFSPST